MFPKEEILSFLSEATGPEEVRGPHIDCEGGDSGGGGWGGGPGGPPATGVYTSTSRPGQIQPQDIKNTVGWVDKKSKARIN
jgi:hypothetical protein